MRNFLFALLMICSYCLMAQNSTDTLRVIKQGKLTMKNNEQINFSNLRYENDQVIFTNIQNQQEEHLFISSIASIDEGVTELINREAFEETLSNDFILTNGVYETMEDLKLNRPSQTYVQVVQPNANRSIYNLINEKGKKNKKAIAFVNEGILYVRPSGIRKYQKNRKGLTYTGNRKNFLMTDYQDGIFTTKAQFGNNGLMIVGVVAGGIVGGLILYTATLNQKDIELDIQKGEILLQKPNR